MRAEGEWRKMAGGRVYVVDDDDSVRKGVERLLRSSNYEVETFPSAEAFLASRKAGGGPACLLLDVRMQGASGLELQAILREMHSTLGIVFITGHGDVPMSVHAIKNGAVDFLCKPFVDDDLFKAVDQALVASANDVLVNAELEAIQQRFDTLTARERQVFGLVVGGLRNKQVADRLGTTEKTVKVHRGRVMEKMQARSLAELVLLARKVGIEGLVDARPRDS